MTAREGCGPFAVEYESKHLRAALTRNRQSEASGAITPCAGIFSEAYVTVDMRHSVEVVMAILGITMAGWMRHGRRRIRPENIATSRDDICYRHGSKQKFPSETSALALRHGRHI
jgi:hypothetical protein